MVTTLMPERMMNRSLIFTVLAVGLTFTAAPASAVVYCKSVGVPKGCVARPGAGAAVVRPGVGAPGRGAVDPGINQPGAAGNRGGGAPGAGKVDPGVNQPGAAGNRR